MPSYKFLEWDVQNRVFVKVPVLGSLMNLMNPCSNSFVMRNKNLSLRLVISPLTATWNLLRSSSVISTSLFAQTMQIVGKLRSVLMQRLNGMILSKPGRFIVIAMKMTTEERWKFVNWSVTSRFTLERIMKKKRLLIAIPSTVNATALLTLEELTLLQLLSSQFWLSFC